MGDMHRAHSGACRTALAFVDEHVLAFEVGGSTASATIGVSRQSSIYDCYGAQCAMTAVGRSPALMRFD